MPRDRGRAGRRRGRQRRLPGGGDDAHLRPAGRRRRAGAPAHDIALLRGARAAAHALAAAARWAPRPARPVAAPWHAGEAVALGGLLVGDGALPELESTAILERYGVPFPPRARVAAPAEAGAAAEALGFPVVVKADGPAHKAATGGVVLDVRSRAAAEQAAERLGGRVLLARQAPAGLEAFCGMRRDPQFGPILAVGLGGVAVESLVPPATALAPLDAEAALRLAAAAGLGAHAGHLAPLIAALSRIASEHPASRRST